MEVILYLIKVLMGGFNVSELCLFILWLVLSMFVFGCLYESLNFSIVFISCIILFFFFEVSSWVVIWKNNLFVVYYLFIIENMI